MSNPFYNYSGAFIPGTLARAEAVAAEFTNVAAGFASLAIQGVDSGAANAYVVATEGAVVAAYADGDQVQFKPLNGNTAASTVNVNGIGVSNIYNQQGQNLVSGQIFAGCWTTLTYSTTFGGWVLTSPTSSTAFTGTISGAAPTHLVGLNAAGGTALAACPIDATFALDVTISPTWTGSHTFQGEVTFDGAVISGSASSFEIETNLVIAPSSGVGLAVTGVSAQWAATLTGASSGTSKGLLVRAGLSSSDYSQQWLAAGGGTLATLYGDGGLVVGAATGGDQGAGTVNAVELYVNGTMVQTSISSANPTASIGLAAVNGAATTFMRSDAAPALSQAISPTWTANHAFTPGSGVGIAVTAVANSYGLKVTGSSTSGESFGLSVQAGTNTSDAALQCAIHNGTVTFLVDGQGETFVYAPGIANTQSGMFQAGYLEAPLNTQTGSYQLVMTDRGKGVYLTGSGSTLTIPANASLAFPVGTTILVFAGSNSVTITITSDTLQWLPSAGGAPRTLAAKSVATLYKLNSTTWLMWGFGIS